jgi:inosose dehydratase
MMRAAVAGAPVSFGVFELTPEGAETVGADELLTILEQQGYAGVDLGPVGFLGRGDELRSRLTEHHLELAGGWVQLPFSNDHAFDISLAELDDALSIFADAAALGPARLPRPTLADGGSPRRAAAPGRGHEIDSLDEAGWSRLATNVARAARVVRDAGFEPTFHHHAGTYVESPDEIDRFLSDVDIDLTLDTGHLALAGGDAAEAVRRWGTRINHLHLKDVDPVELARVIGAGGGMPEVWSSDSFVSLGHGSIDIAEVLDYFAERDFDGWIVIEQDILPLPGTPLPEFLAKRTRDHHSNREALTPWL